MKTSALTAELLAAGCYVVRRGGNHDIWYSPLTKTKAAVPRHPSKEIPPGTELKIRKLLGVPRK